MEVMCLKESWILGVLSGFMVYNAHSPLSKLRIKLQVHEDGGEDSEELGDCWSNESIEEETTASSWLTLEQSIILECPNQKFRS